MVWLVVRGILIDFYTSMWIFCTLLIRFFGKMADFIDFEGDDDDFIVECEPQTVSNDDNNFLDDETEIDNNVEDYYAFSNVCRSESHSSESQTNEVSD